MAFSSPLEAIIQARQNKDRRQMEEGQMLAQSLGGAFGNVLQGQQQGKQRSQWQQTINGLMNDPNMSPQMKQILPAIAQRPELADQILPSLMKTTKPTSPWTVIPSMLSKSGKPIQENKETGLLREGAFEVTPTGRGNSSFGEGSMTWDKATPEDQALAKALYEGNIRPYDLGYRERSVGTKLANEYAIRNGLPPFQSYSGDVHAGVAKNFASGREGRNVLSLNTALGHAKSALDAYKGVQNMDQRFLNVPLNKARAMTNDPNIIKLQTSINALTGELATVFKGSAGTDQEIGHWHNVLSQDLTIGQALGAIQQVNDLLNSRLTSLQYMRSSGMGRPASSPLLSPKGGQLNKEFNAMGQGKQQSSGGWSYVGPAQ